MPVWNCFACCVARALQATIAAVAISGDSTAKANTPYTLSLAAPDSSAGTIKAWKIDWGDGNIQTIDGNPSAVTHNYATAVARWGMPTYVQAIATNQEGASIGANTVAISVTAPPDVTAPTASLTALNINAATSSSYQFTVVYSDDEAG